MYISEFKKIYIASSYGLQNLFSSVVLNAYKLQKWDQTTKRSQCTENRRNWKAIHKCHSHPYVVVDACMGSYGGNTWQSIACSHVSGIYDGQRRRRIMHYDMLLYERKQTADTNTRGQRWHKLKQNWQCKSRETQLAMLTLKVSPVTDHMQGRGRPHTFAYLILLYICTYTDRHTIYFNSRR